VELYINFLGSFFSGGYHVVALTTELKEEDFLSQGSSKKKTEKKFTNLDKLLTPVDVTLFSPKIKLKVLNRINITVDNTSIFHRVSQCKQIKSFDLISYLPTSNNALKALPTVPDFDILCYNPNIDNPPIHFHRKLFSQFIQNGVYLEIPYSPAILNSTMRKYCIYTGHVYNGVGKSRNVILTSAASDPLHIKSPNDVIHLYPFNGMYEKGRLFPIYVVNTI